MFNPLVRAAFCHVLYRLGKKSEVPDESCGLLFTFITYSQLMCFYYNLSHFFFQKKKRKNVSTSSEHPDLYANLGDSVQYIFFFYMPKYA